MGDGVWSFLRKIKRFAYDPAGDLDRRSSHTLYIPKDISEQLDRFLKRDYGREFKRFEHKYHSTMKLSYCQNPSYPLKLVIYGKKDSLVKRAAVGLLLILKSGDITKADGQ